MVSSAHVEAPASLASLKFFKQSGGERCLCPTIYWSRYMTFSSSLQMTQHGAWYVGIGYYELLIQVPFWAIAAIAYAQGGYWIRLPNFVFSLCSLIIMIPIMSELLYTEVKYNRSIVIPIYLPFAIAPALIALKTLFYDGIFGAQSYAKKSV